MRLLKDFQRARCFRGPVWELQLAVAARVRAITAFVQQPGLPNENFSKEINSIKYYPVKGQTD